MVCVLTLKALSLEVKVPPVQLCQGQLTRPQAGLIFCPT